MPSHPDRVRRAYTEAPNPEPAGRTGPRIHTIESILETLLKRFRWNGKDMYADQLKCTSCGALASLDYETGKLTRLETCSPSCPWRLAEEALDKSARS